MKIKIGDTVIVTAPRSQTNGCYDTGHIGRVIEVDLHGQSFRVGPPSIANWYSLKSARILEEQPAEALRYDDLTKPTNPKDAVGSDKIPLHLWPSTATVLGSMALLDGGLKYGRSNYRAVGVRASIYIDAATRHLIRYAAGESVDPDSGLPHLAHVLATVAILVDAEAAGKLNDDREIAGGLINLITEMTPHVKRLKELHKDRAPKHYTIKDNEK